MTTSQAINLLDGLTYSEIREQLELSGCCIDVDLEEYDNQQIYSLALQELTDH
jgi:hypothetical protein